MDVRSWWDDRDGYDLAVVAALVGGALARAYLLTRDPGFVLEQLLAEDAFYYFSTARNVVEGHGLVFNLGVPTNGFHPLYAMLLVPVFAALLPVGPFAPVAGALALLALFNLATAALIYRVVRRLTHPLAGMLAGAVWALSPFVIALVGTGMETPIQAFVLVALAAYLLDVDDRTRLTDRQAVVVGGLLGLAFLARMDSAVFVLGYFGLAYVRRFRADRLDDGPLPGLPRDLLIAGAVGLVVILPWLLWGWTQVGTALPISGQALRLRNLHAPGGGSPLAEAGLAVVNVAKAAVFTFIVVPAEAVWVAAGLVAFVGPLAWVVWHHRDALLDRVDRLGFLVAGAVLYYPFYILWIRSFRPWYFVVTALLATLAVGVLAGVLLERAREPGHAIPAVAVVLTALVVSVPFVPAVGPSLDDKRRAARRLDEIAPADATVASFNTGVHQYYTPDRDVINLDGVMNPESYRALRDERIGAYLQERNVSYIVDPEPALWRLDGTDVELRPRDNVTATWTTWKPGIASAELETRSKTYVIWRVSYGGS